MLGHGLGQSPGQGQCSWDPPSRVCSPGHTSGSFQPSPSLTHRELGTRRVGGHSLDTPRGWWLGRAHSTGCSPERTKNRDPQQDIQAPGCHSPVGTNTNESPFPMMLWRGEHPHKCIVGQLMKTEVILRRSCPDMCVDAPQRRSEEAAIYGASTGQEGPCRARGPQREPRGHLRFHPCPPAGPWRCCAHMSLLAVVTPWGVALGPGSEPLLLTWMVDHPPSPIPAPGAASRPFHSLLNAHSIGPVSEAGAQSNRAPLLCALSRCFMGLSPRVWARCGPAWVSSSGPLGQRLLVGGSGADPPPRLVSSSWVLSSGQETFPLSPTQVHTPRPHPTFLSPHFSWFC